MPKRHFHRGDTTYFCHACHRETRDTIACDLPEKAQTKDDGLGFGFVGFLHDLILRDLALAVACVEFETSLTLILLHQAV